MKLLAKYNLEKLLKNKNDFNIKEKNYSKIFIVLCNFIINISSENNNSSS